MVTTLDICLTHSGRRQLIKVSKENRELASRIDRKIREFKENPELLTRGLKPLNGTGKPAQFRVRIGKLRLVGYMEGDRTFRVSEIMYRRDLGPSRGMSTC